MDRHQTLLHEAAALRALLEPATCTRVLRLYAPVEPLYTEACDAPGVSTAIEGHKVRGECVRAAIARRVAARHRQCVERAVRFSALRAVWQRSADAAERSSPSDGRHGQALPQAHYAALSGAQIRTTRRGEATRIDLIGPPPGAPQPETRWIGTRARVPPMVAADPHAAAWTCGRVLPGVPLPDFNGRVERRNAPSARFMAPVLSLHPLWHRDGPGGTGAEWAAALAAQCPPSASPRPEDRTALVSHTAIGPVVWSVGEVRVFVDRYLAYPKDFARIAAALPYKTVAHVVGFYYLAKHRLGLKRAARRTPHVPGLTAPNAQSAILSHATSDSADLHGDAHADAPVDPPADFPTAVYDHVQADARINEQPLEEREIARLHALLVAGSEERIDTMVP